MARRPTKDDRIEAIRRLLSGLQDGADAHELALAVADLHPTNHTFPGEVFMALGADALDVAGIGRATSIPYEGLLEAHRPECVFREPQDPVCDPHQRGVAGRSGARSAG